jgi:hypothetical protein
MHLRALKMIRWTGALLLVALLGCGGATAQYRAPELLLGSADSFSSQTKSPSRKKAAPKKKSSTAAPAPDDDSAPEGLPPRIVFTEADQAVAAIPGMPDARFWADSEPAFIAALPKMRGAWLAMSTGGEDGAFGAGLLGGWSKAGTRPQFAMVTGVSTGALIAPFAFLGTKYDDEVRDSYTTISAIDIFEIGGKGESLLDTWPLHKLIEKWVTPDLLKAIAEEHATGRRLLILTTNLDAGRPVAWDIGAIATHGSEQALKLIRTVMVAAISIPGAFPPVLIDAEANGRRIQEMHVDGGLAGQFFVAPDSMLTSTSKADLPASDIYVIANMKLNADFSLTGRDTLAILGRSVSAAIKFVIRNAIDRVYATTQRSGIGFNVAFVPPDFSAPARGAFDPDYMKALYEVGYAQGSGPEPFLRQPPDLSDQPKRAAR